ncbi:hypothetical protein ACHAXN_006529 [Cyclotella atomus]
MYNYAMYMLSIRGCRLANLEIGTFMYTGLNPAIFTKDVKKAQAYFEKAAIAGEPTAHTFLAEMAFGGGDERKGCRHSMMAAKMGSEL